MFEQLSELGQQFANESIVKNNAIPNKLNQEVINEVNNSIFSGLHKLLADGNIKQLSSLFDVNNDLDSTDPVVQKLTEKLTSDLEIKFDLSSVTASKVAGDVIPQVLNSLVTKIKDPNDGSFDIYDFVRGLSSNGEYNQSNEDYFKIDKEFGLDQNTDVKLDMEDALGLNNSSIIDSLKRFFS